MQNTIDTKTAKIQQDIQDIAQDLETIETKLYHIHVRYVQLTTGPDALADHVLRESEHFKAAFG